MNSRAMLLDSKVNALSVSRQCSKSLKAMLFNTGNNAFQSFTDSETVQNRKMDEKTLPVVPSSWEEGLGVVENNNDLTYY